ncbi:MAG: twin-arginine translocation signal domain-containing protein [bacterium]
MEKQNGKTNRRGFLVGVAASMGAAAVAVSGAGKVKAKNPVADAPKSGPVLYSRTEEAERYYKTLYT